MSLESHNMSAKFPVIYHFNRCVMSTGCCCVEYPLLPSVFAPDLGAVLWGRLTPQPPTVRCSNEALLDGTGGNVSQSRGLGISMGESATGCDQNEWIASEEALNGTS